MEYSSGETGSASMWMLINANGYTLDDRASTFDAVVVDNGRILAVGTRHELSLQFGHRVTRTLDVAGATVVPGFVDSHLHVAGVGEQALCLDLSGVRSRQEMLERIEQYASQLAPGAWVLGRGWDDNRFVDKALPTLDELDAAAGGRPVLLTRVCCHAYLTNRVALRLAGIDESVADPPDGKYGRDAEGRLNGLLYENASEPVRAAIPPRSLADWYNALRAGMESALKAGITAVHTDDVRNLQSFAAVWTLYHRLIREDGVRLRVHELVDWSYLDECLRAMRELPAADEWLERGAAKLFSDGAFGGRTACLSEDYSDAPGWRGTPMYPREELAERVRVAHEKGFAAAVHAIGDAGLEATVAAFAAAPPVGQRDRLIHAELVRPDLVQRIAGLGDRVVVDIQPRFTVSDFPWLQDRLGRERIQYACAWRTLKEAGLRLAGGSDAPIEPIEPLLGMHAAVARKQPYAEGPGYGMEQALTPEEAVRLFTRDACFANGSEHHKGVIAPGWLADFTVVDRDIVRSADVDDLLRANVLYTIVGGEVAWAADGSTVEWSA
jgi:predicted amidohydrolase YtcJ